MTWQTSVAMSLLLLYTTHSSPIADICYLHSLAGLLKKEGPFMR